jgi:hypothetical protein
VSAPDGAEVRSAIAEGKPPAASNSFRHRQLPGNIRAIPPGPLSGAPAALMGGLLPAGTPMAIGASGFAAAPSTSRRGQKGSGKRRLSWKQSAKTSVALNVGLRSQVLVVVCALSSRRPASKLEATARRNGDPSACASVRLSQQTRASLLPEKYGAGF